MENKIQLIFIIEFLKAISAQDPVDIQGLLTKQMFPLCKQKPVEQAHKCCSIPQLFEIETTAGCMMTDKVVALPAMRGSPDCAERTCVLRNNDLLFDNEEIDKDSVKQYLDGWVAHRREFLPAVDAVKNICLGKRPMLGPPEWCEADKLLFCMNSNFFNKCPNWLETESCTALRAYLETCMPYYD